MDTADEQTVGDVRLCAEPRVCPWRVRLYAAGSLLEDDSFALADLNVDTIEVNVALKGGKVHGSLSRAGKVRRPWWSAAVPREGQYERRLLLECLPGQQQARPERPGRLQDVVSCASDLPVTMAAVSRIPSSSGREQGAALVIY